MARKARFEKVHKTISKLCFVHDWGQTRLIWISKVRIAAFGMVYGVVCSVTWYIRGVYCSEATHQSALAPVMIAQNIFHIVCNGP